MAEADKFEVYKDSAGEFRWRRIAANGKIVADSSEGYEGLQGALDAAHREAGGSAGIVTYVGEEKE